MNLTLWCIIAIPVMVGCMCLNIELKSWGKKPWNILPKCLTTWMVVSTSILGRKLNGESLGEGNEWLIVTLMLFLIADALLELHFFTGMIVFAVGHGILIYWLFKNATIGVVNVVLWIVLWALALLLFKKEVALGKEDPKLYVMMLYPGVLMGMTAIAVGMPFQLGTDYLCVAIGAVLFSISDMIVGKSFFHTLSKSAEYVALTLYYSGIFCFALFMWM